MIEAGGDLGQRRENEAAQVQARVRHDERGRLDDELIPE